MKKINKQFLSQNLHLILLLLLSGVVIWPLLLPGYFSHHDDLQVMRIFEMRKCLTDLQIPCRWVPDMGYGNGYPLFNYYGPLPYYVGALFSFLIGYIEAAKLLFLIPLVLGFLSMYFLAKEIFGDKNLAFFSAVLFGFAPYRALDSYVRGDVDELVAISLIPLVFFFNLKLIKKGERKYFLLYVFSLAIFLTTHNIMILFFMPLLFLWNLYWLKNFPQYIWSNIIALIISLGFAAFFLIPAFFEKGLVQTENLIKLDLDFRAHFVTIRQLFLQYWWGYGASVPGDNDTISFQIGYPLWIVVAFSILITFVQQFRSKSKNALFYLLMLTFVFAVFMTHNKSAFIWEKIPILAYVQFPWRFLALIIFSGSLLASWSLTFMNKKIALILVIILSLVTVGFNYSFFKPETFYPNMTDEQKLSGAEWERQQKAIILDYLPKGAIEAQEEAPTQPLLVTGHASIKNWQKNSDSFSFNTQVDQDATLELPIYDFPNWTTYLNMAKVPHSNNNHLRIISLNLGEGNYQVSGKLEDTPIRKFANIISLLSLVIFALVIKYGKIRKVFS